MSNDKSSKEKKQMAYESAKGLDSVNLAEFAIAPVARSTKDVPQERYFEWYAPDAKGKMRKCSVRFKYGLRVPNYKTEEVLMALCFLLLKQQQTGGDKYKVNTSQLNIYHYLSFDSSRIPGAEDFKMIYDHLEALMDTKIELQYVTPDGKYRRLVKSNLVQDVTFISDVNEQTYNTKNQKTGKLERVSKAPRQLESVSFAKTFIDVFMNEATFFDYYQYLWLQRPIPKRMYRIANNHKEYGTFDAELRHFCEVQLGMTGKSLDNYRDLARRIRKESRIVNSIGEGEYSVVRKKTSMPSGYSVVYSQQPRLFSLDSSMEFWTQDEHGAFQLLRSYNLTEPQASNMIKQYRSYFGYNSPKYITYTISRFQQWIDTEAGELRVPKNKLCALLINVFKEGWYYKDFYQSDKIEPYSREQQLTLISSIAQEKTSYGTDVAFSLPDFEKNYPKQYNTLKKQIGEELQNIGVESNEQMFQTILKNRCYFYIKQKLNEK